MSIYSNIAYDHEKITKLIFDLEALGQGDSQLRKPLFNKLKKEVLVLHTAEEDTLYHELEDHKNVEPMVQGLHEENITIENLLGKASRAPINSDEWHKAFNDLKTALLDHFEKEEEKLFPKAHKELDDIEEEHLAEELKDSKQKQWKVNVGLAPPSASDDFAKKVRAA